jgi:hypothetical protein
MTTDQLTYDSEQILADIRERNEQMFAVSRRTQLEMVEAFEKALTMFADSHDKLAETSEVDWLTRLLRAQATFTRDVADATGKFARQVLEM